MPQIHAFARKLRRARRFAVVCLPLLVLPAIANAAPSFFNPLRVLEGKGARVSAMAVDLGSGRTIDSMNANKRLTPASLTKLVTAAAALDHWTADWTFPTRLMTPDRITDGTLHGTLILQGNGDPSLDGQALWSLAAQLKSIGVQRVTGNLVVDQWPFGEIPCATKDRCGADDRSDTAYNAPLSSIGVDFGNWCLRVIPTRPGQPALIRGCSVGRLPIGIKGTIDTIRSGRKPTFWLERYSNDNSDAIHVGGAIPDGKASVVYRSMSDPARGAGLLLAEMLREIGITIEGKVLVGQGTVAPDTRELAEVDGKPLRSQLNGMLRYSNNYIADVLTLDMAAKTATSTPDELTAAGKLLADYLARVSPGAKNPPTLDSGSGLTPENRMSAANLIGLLRHEYLNTVNFPVFYGGLIVPRQSPFVFLRGGNSAWLDRVALKTGTMNNPCSVFGIAGYMRKKDGGWMAFAIIINGSERHKHIPLYQALAAARSSVEALLAHY